MRNAPSTSLRQAGSPETSAEADLRSTSGAASWSDLIGSAPPASFSRRASHLLRGKRILITGAGGSIGSALAIVAHASNSASLILFDTSEGALYQIDRDLRQSGSHTQIPVLGSVCDAGLLAHVFEQHRPQIVLHAAALKHVPLMEQNPFAAIATNALGTLAAVQAAIAHRAQQFILVSTDKAVDPHSIMGASKRIAELILLTLAGAVTRLTAVRLCNVLGSQGSVLPLFQDQIAHHRPLTVTHPEAQRYFVTLDHAVEAIVSALEIHTSPALLIPDPGAPLRILDLAYHLLRSERNSAAIEFTGLRPGDKLSELLFSSRERRIANRRVSPGAGSSAALHVLESPAPTPALLDTTLNDLREAVKRHDLPRLLHAMHAVVPEYQPSSVITDSLTKDSAPAKASAPAPFTELHA